MGSRRRLRWGDLRQDRERRDPPSPGEWRPYGTEDPLPGPETLLDPITHTFVGASLSASGLRRTTPLATATLILGANAPDIDIVAQAWGPYTAVAWRRGITHGIPALIVLPFLVAGSVLLWDRCVRARRDPEADPARPTPLVGLAALGVWTHPALDWLNTYGMRWLMPFDGRWSYGDSLFILDPWLWLLLGGALGFQHSARHASLLFWLILAGGLSVPVLVAGAVPTWAREAWLIGLAGWVALRLLLGPTPLPELAERITRGAVVAAALFILAMVGQTFLAERVTLAAAAEIGIDSVDDVMVGPVPANPFRSEVILRTEGVYHLGNFSWLPRPRLVLRSEPVRTHPPDPVIRAARSHPDARNYLVWSRFPLFEVQEHSQGWTVRIQDLRFSSRRDAGGLTGLIIEVDRHLTPRRP